MTDKELLELAAKAAGIEFIKYTDEWNGGGLITEWIKGQGGGYHSLDAKVWNPLTNDGDALRLAVKTTLEIDICRTGIAVRTPNGIKVLVDEKEESDPYAATRRAIVRAAAEIGKGMKDGN